MNELSLSLEKHGTVYDIIYKDSVFGKPYLYKITESELDDSDTSDIVKAINAMLEKHERRIYGFQKRNEKTNERSERIRL